MVAVMLATDDVELNSVSVGTSLDLDAQPMVEQLLGTIGHGTFDRENLTSPFGRNDVWAGPTSSGSAVFVKRLRGEPGDVAARLRRLVSFEAVLAAQPAARPLAPRFLGVDRQHGVVAFEMVADATTGAAGAVDESFDEELAQRAGEALAAVHSLAVPDGVELDATPPLLPSLDLVNGLPLGLFEGLSFAGLEVWRLQQGDPALTGALVALAEREAAAGRVPAHCDFRLDQLLVVDGSIMITDWEEFRLADPARDVGSFAGEWLYRAILDIVTNRGDEVPAEAVLDHASLLRRGAEKIERLRPRIQRFWAGYRRRRVGVGVEFAERAAGFAGWHLLDRLAAGASMQVRLSGIERAAAGIGRTVLIDPGKFAPVLGLAVR